MRKGHKHPFKPDGWSHKKDPGRRFMLKQIRKAWKEFITKEVKS